MGSCCRRHANAKRGHTVEVSRPNKGDVDTEVAMVGRAIEAEVDAKRNGGPCWVLLTAVEADLSRGKESVVSKPFPSSWVGVAVVSRPNSAPCWQREEG